MDILFFLILIVSLVAFVIGLIKPTVFSRFIKGVTRKKVSLIFGLTAIVSFILCGITASPINKPEQIKVEHQPVVTNTQIVENESTTTVAEEIATSSASEKTNTTPPVEKTKTAPATAPAKTNPPITQTPTPTPQTDNQNISPISSETISQKNAVKKAKSYLGYSAFSHDGLVAQLEYEQFSHADAVYGADNSGANWNEQAAKKAKQYMKYSAFSRGSLIEQLKYDKFTQEQAEYGANAVAL